MLLDAERDAPEFGDLGVAQAEHLLQRLGHGLSGRPLRGIDHTQFLVTEGASQHGIMAAAQGMFEDVELIGIDRSLDDHLA